MKASRFSAQPIAPLLKQADDGFGIDEDCLKGGVSY
jgi:hypothetical protein